MAVPRPKQLANFLLHMALQWLPITGFCMIEDDLCILRAKNDSQPLPKFARCDIRQR